MSYKLAGGVEWCVTHHGIVDECSDYRCVEIETATGDFEEYQLCDLADPSEPPSCDIRPLFFPVVQS